MIGRKEACSIRGWGMAFGAFAGNNRWGGLPGKEVWRNAYTGNGEGSGA